MPAELPITPPSISEDYCFESWPQLAQDIVGGAVVSLDNSGWSVVLKQSSTPNANQRTYLWFNTSDDRTYRWDSAASKWVSKHPIPAGGGERRIYFGSSSSVPTYDGGAAGTVGDAAGPMWEVDDTAAAKFLLPAGTLPSGTVVANGASGGAETVTLTTAQIPSHTHSYTGKGDEGAGGSGGEAWVGDGASQTTGATGGGEAHSNMPPWYGCLIIKRTARIYYTP
jgi:hypothetical protein